MDEEEYAMLIESEEEQYREDLADCPEYDDPMECDYDYEQCSNTPQSAFGYASQYLRRCFILLLNKWLKKHT